MHCYCLCLGVVFLNAFCYHFLIVIRATRCGATTYQAVYQLLLRHFKRQYQVYGSMLKFQ